MLAVVVAGCAAAPSGGEAPTDDGQPAESSPTESGSPEETAPPVAEISLDGIALGDESVSFEDGDDVLALLGDALGSTPEGEQYEGYPIMTHDWGDLSVTLMGEDDAQASIGVTAPASEGITFQTAEGGIAVGATRDEALDAGAEDGGYDGDGDGKSDYLMLEAQEVPDAESLERPGEPGREFVMLAIEDDMVTSIHAPADDFSDL